MAEMVENGEARVGHAGGAIHRTGGLPPSIGGDPATSSNGPQPSAPCASGTSGVDELPLPDLPRVRQAGVERGDAVSTVRSRVRRQAARNSGAARPTSGGCCRSWWWRAWWWRPSPWRWRCGAGRPIGRRRRWRRCRRVGYGHGRGFPAGCHRRAPIRQDVDQRPKRRSATGNLAGVLLPGDTVVADSLRSGWWRVTFEGKVMGTLITRRWSGSRPTSVRRRVPAARASDPRRPSPFSHFPRQSHRMPELLGRLQSALADRYRLDQRDRRRRDGDGLPGRRTSATTARWPSRCFGRSWPP